MTKASVLIVEDEWIVSEELKELLIRNNFEVIGQAESATQALDIVSNHKPDLALMDINIKGDIDGIELATQLKHDFNIGIIFLTAYNDDYFLRRASKVDPASYFVKPFEERNLIVALDLAFQKLSKLVANTSSGDQSYILEDSIFVKEKQRYIKIRYDQIQYVEADGSYCKLYTSTDNHTLVLNLKQLEERISNPKFARIHRSFLINLDHVDSLEVSHLTVQGISLPISASYREELIKRLNLL